MRFISKIPVPAGGTTIDPRAENAPLIPRSNVFLVEACILNTDSTPTKSLVALEGVTTETATVQFWVLDDTGFSSGSPKYDVKDLWYKLGSPVSVIVGETSDGPALPGGYIYVEVTVGAVAASVIKIGSAP